MPEIFIFWIPPDIYAGSLPDDAQHKGYRNVVVQDIIIKTNNIEFKLERYYSPSEGKTYEASLPDYLDGEFGAGLKSWVLFWYYITPLRALVS